MIIDSHVHLKGGDRFRREFDPDATVRMLDDAGIDRACVFAMSLPSRESNEMTRRAVVGREARLIPYAHVLPEEGDLALVEMRRAVEEWGFRGLKLHCGEVVGEAQDEHIVPFLECAAELGIPVLLDCLNRPGQARLWVTSVPEAKVIIAHLGGNVDEQMASRFIALARAHANVHLDTSYLLCPWMIREAVRVCGPDKVVFGSDGAAGLYPASLELAKVRAYDFTASELELILSGNIRRLLGL
jgi:predicted TIM-barrel fold metal-dependent hydrolase